MILYPKIPAVRSLLHAAAARRGTVSFAELFKQFDQDVEPHDVYDTLEAACVELADWKDAIYSVVLAKAATKLPGDGFFDIFRFHRAAEYVRIAGDTHVHGLDHAQRSAMVSLERPRVYAHASS
jgi:hypothetical protein